MIAFCHTPSPPRPPPPKHCLQATLLETNGERGTQLTARFVSESPETVTQ